MLCLREDPVEVIVEEIKAVLLDFGIEPSPAGVARHPRADGMNPLVRRSIPLWFGHHGGTESWGDERVEVPLGLRWNARLTWLRGG